MTADKKTPQSAAGLAQGGLGGPEDEILEAGQEEVFSRIEVETGRIEHNTNTQIPPSPMEDDPSHPKAADQGDRHG